MSDELKDLYDLASRALTCQAEIGHNEIIIEARGIGGTSQEKASSEDSPARPKSTTTESSPLPRALTVKNPKPDDKQKSEPLDYGPIPPKKDDILIDVPAADAAAFTDIESHRDAICECVKCPLGKTRTKFVYGTGNPNAKIMFVGEAPGRDEDLQGEPFVGRAGKLLDKIIAAMGFERKDIYIANILKCRPPNNRDPQPDEMEQCMPYLKEQIRLIKPQFICALGRIAVQGLLDTTAPLGKLRKRWHRFEGIPLIATYHPAALLRFQKYKRDTWEDMQVLMAEYEKLNNG